jgi:hypothetical protein
MTNLDREDARVASGEDEHSSRHSVLTVRTHRSQMALARGALIGVQTTAPVRSSSWTAAFWHAVSGRHETYPLAEVDDVQDRLRFFPLPSSRSLPNLIAKSRLVPNVECFPCAIQATQ